MVLPSVLGAVATAVLFEAATLVATQDKAVRAHSPWQSDPYNVIVSVALIAVPMLVLALVLRLPAWRAPGGPDRAQQSLRAAGALVTLVGLTVLGEWAAVAVRAHIRVWNGWSAALIVSLAVLSVLTLAVAVALWRRRSPRGSARAWRHDWLADVALTARRIPLVRHLVTATGLERIRTHALVIFVGLSVLVAIGVMGVQAVGEGLTDPLLISWEILVEAATNLAFCLTVNAAAGFIARPARGRVTRTAETSIVTGTVGLLLMLAFRDQVWSGLGLGPVESVPLLVGLTVAAGLVVAAVTAVVLTTRTAVPYAGPRGRQRF